MKSQKGKYVWIVKVGEKGQIVIPKEAREIFKINKGDALLLLGDKGQGLAIVPQERYLDVMQSLMKEENRKEDD